MSLTIWQYWEGPRPPWIELCMRSVAAHAGARMRCLGPSAWAELRDTDRDLDVSGLYITHRVDYLRAYVLHRYGGIWVDADFVQLRPFDAIDQALERSELVAYFQDGYTPMSNLFAARPGSVVAKKYYDLIAGRLRRNGRVQHWTELAEALYAQALLEDGVHPSVTVLPHRLVQPIAWTDIHKAITRDMPVDADAMGVMLYGHTFKRLGIPVDAMTSDELRALPGLLGRLFRAIA